MDYLWTIYGFAPDDLFFVARPKITIQFINKS
jgi:hypothetical protein